MLGLNLHRPPFVVVAVTDGALPGYSAQGVSQLSRSGLARLRVPLPNLSANFEIVSVRTGPVFSDHRRTSKKPNS
jgi:hypothetical protein